MSNLYNMSEKSNTRELIYVSSELGIDIVVLNRLESEQYINKVIDTHMPFKITGHLQMDVDSITLSLEENEYSYSEHLKSEPAYIFFDQDGLDRKSVVIVKDAKLVGKLMENSFGMEYFVSNERNDYLIAVNWYVIHVAGSAINDLSKLI
ncbi:hypothetical protein [Lysinibacillus xylanilyticus]|uniref:hypothetical protein n=1 Tax=Lysinibacillus xylanilyticus TaxID=582475 RepID=UPI003805235B